MAKGFYPSEYFKIISHIFRYLESKGYGRKINAVASMVNNTKGGRVDSRSVNKIRNAYLLSKPDDVRATIDHNPKVGGIEKGMSSWLVGEYGHVSI